MVRYRELITFNSTCIFQCLRSGLAHFRYVMPSSIMNCLCPLGLPGNDARATNSRLSDLGGTIYRDPY